MDIFIEYLKVFVTGGVICGIGQLLIDRTKMTSARILVVYVVAGVILTALGVYQYVVDFGGAGATIPLTGFGYAMAKGVMKAVDEIGLLGVFTGAVAAAAAGISSAIFFGYVAATFAKSKASKAKK